MNLLIINTLPVPSGQASVNRILSLGKGLVENGKDGFISSIDGIADEIYRIVSDASLYNEAQTAISKYTYDNDVIKSQFNHLIS